MNIVARPVLQLMLIYYVSRYSIGDDFAQDILVKVTFYQSITTVMMGVPLTFLNDQAFGTLSLALVSPVARSKLFVCRVFGQFKNVIVSGLACFLYVVIAEPAAIDTSKVLHYVLLYFVAICSGTSFALAIGVITLLVKDWQPPMSVGTGLMLGTTGAIIPLAVFPSVLQGVFRIIPLTNVNLALDSLSDVDVWDNIAVGMAGEMIVCLFWLIMGYLGFRYVLSLNERVGIFDHD